MRIYITGHRGQLGSAIERRASANHEVFGGDQPQFNITNFDQVRTAFAACRPQLVIHCAAFTDVDEAARQPELAYRVNGLGTQHVAQACAALGATLLYISSNEVFDGEQSEPYREFDQTHPVNPYGYSKLAGEWFTQRLAQRFYIVRTSWLTSSGGRNFVHRIQQLADERGQLQVVTDEVASPTFVSDLTTAILQLIETERYGVYHLVNAGHCSRFEYAKTILEATGRQAIPVQPLSLADYPRPSTPPRFSPLANQCAAALGITLRPWQAALADFLKN